MPCNPEHHSKEHPANEAGDRQRRQRCIKYVKEGIPERETGQGSYFVPNSTLTKRRTPNSVRVEAQLLRWRRFRRRALLQRSQQSDS